MPVSRAYPSLLRGKRVLELGTGLGLWGIVAQWLGAEVTLSDYQPDALEFARWNASKNGIPHVQTLLADWRHFPEVDRLTWFWLQMCCTSVTCHPLWNVLTRATAKHSHVLIADPWRARHGSLSWRWRA